MSPPGAGMDTTQGTSGMGLYNSHTGNPHSGSIGQELHDREMMMRQKMVPPTGGEDMTRPAGAPEWYNYSGMKPAKYSIPTEAKDRMEQDAEHVQKLWKRASELFDRWELNGSAEARYHGNLNIRPRGPNGGGLDVNRLMSECRNVMFSAGSACASGSGRTSHVLEAIGLPQKLAKCSIRLGFGRYTTLEEIEEAGRTINEAAKAQGAL